MTQALAMASKFQVSGSPIKGPPYAKAFEAQNESLAEWSFEVKKSDIKNLLPSIQQPFTVNGMNRFRLNPDAI